MRYCLLLLCLLAASAFTHAQTGIEPYAKEWKKADSLLRSGFPESASKIARLIYDKAWEKGEQVQLMKAEMFLLTADFQRDEDAFQKAIATAESNAAKAGFPNNAIWQSIAAQLYWTYYQQHRWNILQRTRINAGSEGSDFEQWSAARFFDKATALYQASLTRAAELEKIPIGNYDPILIKGTNTRSLRPTLFDLLAFRALEYYEHDEKDITRPAFSFVMNDERAFAPAASFIQTSFRTKDSSSLQWQALRLYQRILSMHRDDAKKDALIDADLHRLQFAYNKSVHPDKKELYKKALEDLARAHAAHPLSATASYRIAQMMMTTGRTRADFDQPITPAERKPANFVAIRERLEKIIATHPGSEGAVLADQLMQQILSKQLQLTAEEVVLPSEPSRILISYRNVPKSWFRLIRLDNSRNKWVGSHYGYSEQLNNELLTLRHLKQWETILPAASDHELHRTELAIEALPAGTYALVGSSGPQFSKEEHLLSYVVFQVSQLSAVQGNGKGYALDRKTGQPLASASVDFFRQRYNDNIRGYDLVKTATVTTDQEGRFDYRPSEEHNSVLRVRHGRDSVVLPGQFAGFSERGPHKPEIQTFFFTDRAIYRPGQTIYFKGIMVKKEDGSRKNSVIVGEETEVTLYDVNGQKVSSKKFTTNEFGSFSGSFTAPEGLLNGSMRITNKTGGTDFSVEEYKRPKFSVVFDTLTKEYALNETVTLEGRALAYAGNTIGNAAVRYRVVRNARFPYWWYAWRWGFPQSPQMEIASGTTETDAQGRFTIAFKAIPDPSVDPQSLPVFSYTVTADVTDINGETRTGNTVVSVGYTALVLSVNAAERSTPADLDTINIQTLNLNNQFVPTQVQLRIGRLRMPDEVLRKRIWPAPDQFIMDSVSFRKLFPNDVYRDEDNHLTWETGEIVLERSIRSSRDGKVAVGREPWSKNGWYLIELTASDKNGKDIKERRYVQVWDARNEGKLPEALTVVPASSTAQPGDVVPVYAISGYDRLHMLREVSSPDNRPATEQIDYSGQPVLWTKQITEAERGGILVHYIAVKDNRVYTSQAYINVPWSNKDLDISWETHRDKLLPGSQETWTMVVRGSKKEKVAAEMVATLYDASLDAFRPHAWNIYGLFPPMVAYSQWMGLGFGQTEGRQLEHPRQRDRKQYQKVYDRLYFMPYSPLEHAYMMDGVQVRRGTARLEAAAAPAPVANAVQQDMATSTSGAVAKSGDSAASGEQTEEGAKPGTNIIQPRTNLRETAFFYPQLKTDADGNVRISFTIPEALTEWKLMALGHTKDMSYGMLSGTVKTQKDLMVTPNLPRFVRQGDEITVSARISNLSTQTMNGTATIELLNAVTMQPVSLAFRVDQKDVAFSAPKEGNTSASWTLHVPESMYEPVLVRILARAGNFTDGEENAVPVVTNRMLVTETLPLWINGDGTKDFSFGKLKASDSSNTLRHHGLTIEYTGNPAWYAVQSLPYLMEYPYECAEQVFNRYYATALAAHIVAQSPRIKAIFDKWKMEADFSSFASPLEQNQELKSALLAETPWVMEAKTETEQRKRLGRLFDTYKLSKDLDRAMQQLRELQLPEGGFPWFRGMRPDRFITQYIVTGLGRLQQLGVNDGKGATNDVLAKALPYLDKSMKESYDLLLRNKAVMDKQQIGYTEIQYLYMRSFFKTPLAAEHRTAFNYYKSQAAKHWASFNPYMKGMTAIALHRNDDRATAGNIIQSLKETAIRKEEMGMYWMQRGYSYWWYEAPIEAQALLIECFTEVANDQTSVDAMKVWLLKNKQTQSWETTKATADACYALLLSGTDWLGNEPAVTIKAGNKTIRSSEQDQQAGSGHFKVSYTGSEVSPSDGNIRLTVSGNKNSTSWGAMYWQYFEQMDKISSAATPLEIRKQLYKEIDTDRGPVLEPITSSSPLSVGDKVKVRIEIVVDRDMEYVHLKDMRASCFEPVNVISAYQWQGGLGYYESTKDISTNFFFDYLRKGKYVFEYPMFVHQKGEFSNGIATIQCMYAPEFASHSEGIRVSVK